LRAIEYLLGWLSHYRRPNAAFDRKPNFFFRIWIAMGSIISRRLLAAKSLEIPGSNLRTDS
jgi:hypothetical protein